MKPIWITRIVMLRVYQESGLRIMPDIFTKYPEVESPLDDAVWLKVHWMGDKVWFNGSEAGAGVHRIKMPLCRTIIPRRTLGETNG